MAKKNELKARYENLVKESWGITSGSMLKYLLGKCSSVVLLDNDNYYVMEKPKINEDISLCYTCRKLGSYENAKKQKLAISSNKEDFINENLKQLNSIYNSLMDKEHIAVLEDDIKDKEHKHKYLKLRGKFKSPIGIIDYPFEDNDIILSDRDRETLLKALEDEKRKFTKRLNSYVNKHGLSKVHISLFCMDD